MRIYDFISNCLLTEIKFKQGGTALTWAPRVVSLPYCSMFTWIQKSQMYITHGFKLPAHFGLHELLQVRLFYDDNLSTGTVENSFFLPSKHVEKQVLYAMLLREIVLGFIAVCGHVYI